MKPKILFSALVCLAVPFLCGCSTSQLENTDILTTYYADKNSDTITLGGGVANVRTLSDSMADNPVSLIHAEGSSLSKAEDRLIKSADHPLFFGGIRALIIGDGFAEEGIGELIESIKDDYKLRSESMFFITNSEPEKIVIHKAINDFTGGFGAESLLDALNEEGKIFCSTIADVFEMMSVKKVGLAAASVDVKNEILSFDGYGIFDGEKMIETTSGDVSNGINMFLNNKCKFDFYIDEKKYTAEKIKQKKEAFLNGDNLFFDIGFEFELENKTNDEKVKKQIKEELIKYANASYDEARLLGCDFLNLYRIYQKKYRYEFENADYKSQLQNSSANIYVSLK